MLEGGVPNWQMAPSQAGKVRRPYRQKVMLTNSDGTCRTSRRTSHVVSISVGSIWEPMCGNWGQVGVMDWARTVRTKGLLRELNPGPLAPEARIIPLDQTACDIRALYFEVTSLREFACVYSRHPGSSAWFLASVLRSVTPFPADPLDPLDRLTSSQIAHLASSIGRQKLTVLGP